MRISLDIFHYPYHAANTIHRSLPTDAYCSFLDLLLSETTTLTKKKNGPKDQNDGRADAKGRKQKVEQSVTKRSWLFHRNKHSYELSCWRRPRVVALSQMSPLTALSPGKKQ